MSEQEKQVEEYSFYSLFVPLTKLKAICIIVIAGIIVFFNSLFNPFQGDDLGQIVNNPQVTKLGNIPTFFFQSLVYSGINSIKFLHIYYKPILFTLFTIIYSLFGSNSFPFHLVQLILDIVNSILVFFILSKFFKQGLSLFLSIVFLIHPINSESVIYIADMQEVLFLFFGLLALWLTIKAELTGLSYKRLLAVSLLLLCSLLSKETGIVFLILLLLYVGIFNQKLFKHISVAVVSTLIVYVFLRFISSLNSSSEVMSLSPIQQSTMSIKLLTMPKILFYYLFTFTLPIHLAIGQDWIVKETNFADFYFPLSIDILFILSVFCLGIFILKKQKKHFRKFIFFISWFFLGIIINLQIIPLDVTVADRWFYFPIIGLLGLIGLLVIIFEKKITNQYIKKTIISVVCCILIVLSILTIIRNSEWQSRFSLLSHDVKYAQSPLLNSYYGGMLIINNQLDQAKPYLDESVDIDPRLGHNLNNLAIYYEKKGDESKAKSLYLKNISLNSDESNSYVYISYEDLAHIYLNEKNPQKAEEVAQKAVTLAPSDMHATIYLAIAEYQLGENNESLQTIKKLYRYAPSPELEQLYFLINSHKHFALNSQLGATVIY